MDTGRKTMTTQDITREYSFQDDGFTILRNAFTEETHIPLRQEANEIIPGPNIFMYENSPGEYAP
jgi:hypothetical protein